MIDIEYIKKDDVVVKDTLGNCKAVYKYLYKPLCSSCQSFAMVQIPNVDSVTFKIFCRAEPLIFSGLSVGHFKNDDGKDTRIPNVRQCSYYALEKAEKI